MSNKKESKISKSEIKEILQMMKDIEQDIILKEQDRLEKKETQLKVKYIKTCIENKDIGLIFNLIHDFNELENDSILLFKEICPDKYSKFCDIIESIRKFYI